MARLKLAFEFKRQSQTSDQHLRSFITDVFSKLDNLSSGDGLKTDEELEIPLNSDSSSDNKVKPLVHKKSSAVRRRDAISPKRNPPLTKPKVSPVPTPIKLIVQTNVKPENEEDYETIVGDDNTECYNSEINHVDVDKHEGSLQNYDEEYIDEEHLTDFEPVVKQRRINVEPHRIKTESGAVTHMCSTCNKAFSTRTNLLRHMLSHENQKPFQCTICGRGFTQSGSLKQHMYIHTGERPYECPICNAAFTQGKTLKFHMRRHTGEKPFTCGDCGISFRQRDGLKVKSLKGFDC